MKILVLASSNEDIRALCNVTNAKNAADFAKCIKRFWSNFIRDDLIEEAAEELFANGYWIFGNSISGTWLQVIDVNNIPDIFS